MKITFDIDSQQDDAGVWEFWAIRDCDIDYDGMVFPIAVRGYGETESEAIVSLIEKLDMLEESLTERK
jgi:hypothetical protein